MNPLSEKTQGGAGAEGLDKAFHQINETKTLSPFQRYSVLVFRDLRALIPGIGTLLQIMH